MIINKNTSDPKLVSSLVVLGENKKPIADVVEFDTQTMVVTLEGGGTANVKFFQFVTETVQESEEITSLLHGEESDPRKIGRELRSLRSRVAWGEKVNVKKAMVEDSLPADVLALSKQVKFQTFTCSNCGAVALIGIAADSVYTLVPPATDKVFYSVQELDKTALVCDGCGNSVSIMR